MSEQSGLRHLFHLAFEAIIQIAIQECGYVPEYYQRLVDKFGGAQAAAQLLAEPVSDDSLQLWARGRRDLTVEAVVCTEEWKELFAEQELAVAERRHADWAVSLSESCVPAEEGLSVDMLPKPFFPEDDLAWGEELIHGVAVCQKLAQENSWIEAGHPISGGWVVAHYRRHLAECATCAGGYPFLGRGIEEFDRRTLGSLAKLLTLCVISLNCDERRARELLSKEWKAAGFDVLPSEAETAGITEYGWKDPGRSEFDQLQDWVRVLSLRAGLLCALVGDNILRYEETYGSEGNPWISWRTRGGSTTAAGFVRGLSDDEFLAILLARNVALIQRTLWTPSGLTLPSDGDLSDVEGVLRIEWRTDSSDWAQILAANFPTQRVLRSTRTIIQDTDQGLFLQDGEAATDIPSDLSALDWRQILYLAWSAAWREAGLGAHAGGPPTVLAALSELKDLVESHSAVQMPIIELLERIAAGLSGPNRQAASESIAKTLGSDIYSALSVQALTCAVGAEQVLHNREFANPGLGVAGLCMAFEQELKHGFLVRFRNYLRDLKVCSFPNEESTERGKRQPRIIIGGHVAPGLSLERIRQALGSPQPEAREFCHAESIDLGKLVQTIGLVRKYRNPAVHESPMSFEQAWRIRERLLGIQSGDGGVFAVLVSKPSRSV